MADRSTTDRSPQSSPRWRKRLAVSLGALVVLFALTETICRLLPGEERVPVIDFTSPDPDLLWRLRPSEAGPFATNELDLRDDPYEADAQRKILMLGDSVAWGDGLEHMQDCFPYLLEELLRQADPQGGVEVINASVPGWSTFQQATYLEKHGLALEPDSVVLMFCLNDVTSRYVNLAQYGGGDEFLGMDTWSFVPGVRGWLLRYSRAAQVFSRALQRRAREREEYDVSKMARDEWSVELEEAWNLVLEEIDSIAALARGGDLPLLVAIVPYRFQMRDPAKSRQPQDRLIEALQERGIPFLDLLPELVRMGSGATLFRDPSHLSIAGHRETARILFERLSRDP